MEIEDEEGLSPAITAIGSLFKLTEVYLWDDGCKEIGRGSSLPKHIIFKYDDDEDLNEGDYGDGRVIVNLDVDNSANGEGLGDDAGAVLEEDMDLTQQMSTLGLPLSFLTKKDHNSGPKRGKRNGILRSCRQEKSQDDSLHSTKLCEKENFLDEEFNKAEIINLNDMILEEDVCDESCTKLRNSDATTVHDFSSCMISDQPQLSCVTESSDTVIYDQNNSCYCNGSSGDWTAIWDSYYQTNYFYNVKTHESTWHPPPGMEHLALDNITSESNADLVRKDAGFAISSNDSELTCKSSEGECATTGKQLDQLVSRFTANGNESQVLDVDCSALSQPCSSMEIPYQSLDLDDNMKQMFTNGNCDNDVKEKCLSCDELLIFQVEEDREASAGEIENEFTPAVSRRKKKAKKSRSKKKSQSIGQEEHFQCTVDSYYGGIGKYWCQRYLLFSRFDQGIKMDEEGWFSVTPETIAKHHASRCGNGVVIDCFSGAGGNAIQFAKTGKHVIAIDIDPNKITYAKHNAAIYGVEDHIDFVIGDSFSLASKLKADTVFMSPPWGGPEYSKVQTYTMDMLKPHDGQLLFDTFKEIGSMIVMFLPRNVDLNQLAELCLSAGPLWSVEVEKNFLNDRLKAVTAYFCKASV